MKSFKSGLKTLNNYVLIFGFILSTKCSLWLSNHDWNSYLV